MNTENTHSWRKNGRCLLALAILPLVFGSSAFAQTTTSTDDKKDDTIKLEKYIVTGSYIPAAIDEANAAPVLVITSKDIDATGVSSTLLDVLRKAVPQVVGGNNLGVENGNTGGGANNGGSALAVRNTTTLVLIDGMRAAFSPVAGGGGVQFVDLNVVPVSAVERIEILTDGASAIYGSDAVGGVVNIILKKNYQGMEMGGFFGISPSDKGPHFTTKTMHLVAGASSGKTNLTVAAEWTKHDPLFERNYNYTSGVFLTSSYAGVINDNVTGQFYKLNPTLNAPPSTPKTIAQLVAAGVYIPVPAAQVPLGFDLSGRPTFQGSLDKQIASIALEHAISDSISFKSTVLYARTYNQYNLNPQPISFRVNTNATNTNLPNIPVTDPNFQIRNRLVGFSNRYYKNSTDSLRGTVELTGRLNDDWGWNASAAYNKANQTAIGTSQILQSALLAAINSGLINLSAIVQDPAKITQANFFGDAYNILSSDLITYDFRVNGRLFDLPGGSVYTALGVGYRRESLTSDADKNSILNPATGTSAWNNGVTVNPFNKGRNVQSEFLEVKIPLTSKKNNIAGFYTADIDAAVRHEKYSDNKEKPTVPKVSLRWLPFNDEFMLRATYSKSFSSPTLYQLFGPTGQGATPSLVGIDAYNSAGQPLGTKFPSIQGQQQGGSNAFLLPSHAKNYTVGFIYSPKALKGFSVGVSYYNIKETDLAGGLASTVTMIQDVERFGTASLYWPYIHLGDFGQLGGTRVTGPGQLHANPSNVYVDQNTVNIGAQNQSGLDIELKYNWSNSLGNWDVTSNWNFIKSFILIPSPAVGPQEYAGTNGFGTIPKFREYTTLRWQSGAYTALLASTYDKSVTSAGDGSKIPAYYTFDIQGSADMGKLSDKLKGFRLSLGINNLFNKYPPVDATVFSDPPADTGLYSPYGRFYYMDLKYKF